MNDNGAFRKKRVYFTQVSNEVLRDRTLSTKAKGLYAIIQSYITIENFVLYKNTLRKDCKEGEKAFESMWKELKDKGYLVQYKIRNEKGGFYYEYELLDISQTPKKEGVEKAHAVKGSSGKGGVHNNTDSNNTYLKEDEEAVFLEYSKAKGKRLVSPEKEKLREFLKSHSKDLILKAIDIMVTDAEKITLKYIQTTLEDWKNKAIQTVEEVDKSRLEWQQAKNKAKENKQKNVKPKPGAKPSTFNNFKQRDYDFDDLKKKLLGWDNIKEG